LEGLGGWERCEGVLLWCCRRWWTAHAGHRFGCSVLCLLELFTGRAL
jgi:hypothetical protein